MLQPPPTCSPLLTLVCRYMDIFDRYCSGCTFVDPIAVPVIIHRCAVSPFCAQCRKHPLTTCLFRKDLERIAPLWLSKTALMRSQVPPATQCFSLTQFLRIPVSFDCKPDPSAFEGKNVARFLEQQNQEQGKTSKTCKLMTPPPLPIHQLLLDLHYVPLV